MHPPTEGTIALVTNAELRFGFNVIRSLLRAGIQCYALGRISSNMSARLPGIVGSSSYPNPFLDPEGYIESISTVASRFHSVVLIPAHEDIFVASSLRDKLPAHLHLAVGLHSNLISLHDKWNLRSICANANVPYPNTSLIVGGNIELTELPYADSLVLKPRFGEGGRGVCLVNALGASEAISGLPRFSQYLCQEHVEGRGAGVAVLAHDGTVVAIGGHRRIREIPRTGGTSCAREAIEHSGMFNCVKRIVQKINATGVFMFEFRWKESTDEYWLIDANPRYWGSLSTYINSGVNIPLLHFEMTCGQLPESMPVTRRNEAQSRWLLGELRYMAGEVTRLRFHSAMNMWRSPKEQKIISYEDFSSNNLGVFARQAIGYIWRYLDQRPNGRAEVARTAFFENLA